MKRFPRIALLIFTVSCCAGACARDRLFRAAVYLTQGGKNVDASPEFYWELEVKRLAREFHPVEKLVRSEKKERRKLTKTPELFGARTPPKPT